MSAPMRLRSRFKRVLSPGEMDHSPFVPMALNVVVGRLFEHDYAKESARYLEAAYFNSRCVESELQG